MYLLRLFSFRIQPEKHTFFILIFHMGKESPDISTVFFPGPVASDPASESVSVDAPAKKVDQIPLIME